MCNSCSKSGDYWHIHFKELDYSGNTVPLQWRWPSRYGAPKPFDDSKSSLGVCYNLLSLVLIKCLRYFCFLPSAWKAKMYFVSFPLLFWFVLLGPKGCLQYFSESSGCFRNFGMPSGTATLTASAGIVWHSWSVKILKPLTASRLLRVTNVWAYCSMSVKCNQSFLA